MTISSRFGWEIAAGVVAVACMGTAALWLALRKRPTTDELEQRRRDFLVKSGRIVDGMLLDVYEIDGGDGRKLAMLLFNYRIGGVDYECSQDVTNIAEVADTTHIRLGFPCSVRYQPGNPQNSIVIAELWTGLRAGLPVLPAYHNPEPNDMNHLHPDKG